MEDHARSTDRPLRLRPLARNDSPVRLLALSSGLLLIGSFLWTMYRLTAIIGGTTWLVLYVSVTFVLATVLSRLISARAGMLLGGLLFALGLGGYMALIPRAYFALFTVEDMFGDVVGLLTGRSVALFLNADLWVVSVAPGPVFVTWHLTLRRRYAMAAMVGGVTVAFFALTGDASRTTTMIGMAGLLGLLGLGSVERSEGTWEQVLDVGILLALAIFAARTVDIVPREGGMFGAQGGEVPTLESSLVGADDQVPVRGTISLDSEVRFTVAADRPAYWRVAAYEEYTGSGWATAPDARAYPGELAPPAGESRRLDQEYHVRTPMESMPAAWKPHSVGDDIAGRTLVTDPEGLRPSGSLAAGDRYTVTSLRPQYTADELRAAGSDYPDDIVGRYLQVPGNTPDRLDRHARRVTSESATPSDAIEALVEWLQREKEYSLEVSQARWDAADAFVFELDRGYCTHFATALCVMLRLLGIPARFVVGYTSGEQGEDGRWTVRGLHSHAWVEVFFPGIGWVNVDPTPQRPLERTRVHQLEREGIEPPRNETRDREVFVDEGELIREEDMGEFPEEDLFESGSVNSTERNETATETGTVPSPAPGTTAAEEPPRETPGSVSDPILQTPRRVVSRQDRLSVVVGFVGLALGAYRLGLAERAYRSVWLRYQEPTGSPTTDVERAFDRLEYHLARRSRVRQPDETPRDYLAALDREGHPVDDRAWRVVELYERARYSGRPTAEEAREAIDIVDGVIQR